MKTVPDSDDRVRCWFCARRTRLESIPIPSHDTTGKPCTVYVNTKSCALGLGYDPVTKRRCDQYVPIPAWRREALPASA